MSLGEARRRQSAELIAEAAMRALFRDGPNATADAVAELAGVGRATVFRYYPTRDELLAAGLRHAYERFVQSVPTWEGGDPDEWLADVLRAVVSRSLRGGSGYLRTLLDPGHEALAAVVASRGSVRNKFNVGLANELRRAYRGPLPAPRHLVDGVGLLTGPHAIWGLHNDLGLTERRIVERLAWMLRALTLEDHG